MRPLGIKCCDHLRRTQHSKIPTRLDVMFIAAVFFCTTKQKVSPEYQEAAVFLWAYYCLLFMCLRTGILLWNKTVGKCYPPLEPGAGMHQSFIFAFQPANHAIKKVCTVPATDD